MGNIFSVSISFDGSCDRILSCLGGCISGCVNHTHDLKQNLKALENNLQMLKDRKMEVERRVRLDESRNMERLPTVQTWLSRMEAAESEAEQLIDAGKEEVQRLCLGGYCSRNCKASYRFANVVVCKLQEIQHLVDEGNFEVVSARIPAPEVDERPVGPTVGQEPLVDEVWNLLVQENVGVLGLHGMGGVGKTTLLTQINNRFRNTQNDFNVVIWVVVSKDAQHEKIQEAIGEKIGLLDDGWRDKTPAQKTQDIYNVLKRKRFVLLLDDVWAQISLPAIGIPLPDINNRCKIVLTTRSKDVCGLMEVDVTREVKCLNWNNAWDLFRRKVGESTLSAHPYILGLAKEVARKCGGLPLALVTVGRAMAWKTTVQEWQQAINVLNSSTSDHLGIKDGIFPALKFSFDNLKNQKLKSCFLYCALFPEDYNIHKRYDLIDRWIGEGILDGSSAELEGFVIIAALTHSCLLIEENEHYVKMHDVVRDMALWITNECEAKEYERDFYVQTGAGLNQVPKVEEWESMRRVSLMRNQIKNLKGAPKCQELLTLLLSDNLRMKFSNDFFRCMPNLRVLDLSNSFHMKQLPEEISELVSLQYLNLSGTLIRRLPKAFENLLKLKYLNLDRTLLESVPLLSHFPDLQVLRLLTFSGFSMDEYEKLVEEMQSMESLNLLTINIAKVDTRLEWIIYADKLKKCIYELSLTQCVLDSLDISCHKSLHFINISGGTVKKLEVGRLCKIDGPCRLESWTDGCFGNLETVKISACRGLKDLTSLILVPSLKKLLLYDMYEMEEIISEEKAKEISEGQQSLVPFTQLEELSLVDMGILKSIYWTSLPFPSLMKIHVALCPNLMKLPLGSESAKGCDLVIRGDKRWLDALVWDDEGTKDVFHLEVLN